VTEAADDVRYEETAASWWWLLFGPGFAAAGILVEVVTQGPVLYPVWLVAGVALTGFTAMWVYARKRYVVVLLTRSTLREGQETLPVERIAGLADADDKPGGMQVVHASRVLGGGMAAPRKYDELLLRLDDGTVVLAWARDGAALREALRELLSA